MEKNNQTQSHKFFLYFFIMMFVAAFLITGFAILNSSVNRSKYGYATTVKYSDDTQNTAAPVH